jgi:dTDP-glucose 4,6-dehydratase
MLLERGQVGAKYNFGGDSERTNLEVVQLICQILDRIETSECSRRSLITFVTDRPGHDQRYAIDASKAQAELGWWPLRSFESGLEDTVKLVYPQCTMVDASTRARVPGRTLGLDQIGERSLLAARRFGYHTRNE